MNNTEQKTIEFADIDDSNDTEIQKKLDQSRIQYPNWKGTKPLQTLRGKIIDVLTFMDLNGKDKHGILYNLQTDNAKFPIVSVWLNTVLASSFKKMSPYQPSDSKNFDEITRCHKANVGRLVAIRYEGKEQSSTKGFQPYDNYTVTEI